MLEDKDIQKLIEILATKKDLDRFTTKEDLQHTLSEHTAKIIEIFVTKDDLKEAVSNLVTKEEFANLQSSIDSYAKKVDTYAQEMIMLAHKVDRHEKWFHQIAEKLGIRLEY